MATIRTAIQVQDAATATLNKIDSGLNKVNRGFENVNTQMNEVPTKGLQATQKMTQSALQAEMAYKAEAQQLSIIEKEAKNILATKGTESLESKEILASLYEQRVLVSSLKADYERITQSAKGTSESIRENEENQRKFKNEINSTTTSANNLWDKIKGIALTIGGLAGVKKILNLSDEMATTSARLSLIVDDKGSVEQLENKIFASAIRSRAEYQDTADMIGKLGSQAKGAFKNNDELIAFAEQLNKNFVLAGTNQQGIASAQLQITQALASGVLRGEELNAVFENATPVIQKIADYLDVPIGKIRDLAKEGKLSAQVVKNALLASADETNAAFEKMPMTWSQIWTKMKNIALKAFQPVLKKINEFDRLIKENKIYLWAILMILLIVTVFMFISSITFSIRDNMKKIGIFRAIGVTRRDTLKIFIFEALLLELTGIAAAVILCCITVNRINKIYMIQLLENKFRLLFINWQVLGVVLAIVFVIGLFTAVLPIYQFSKMKPVNLLNHNKS